MIRKLLLSGSRRPTMPTILIGSAVHTEGVPHRQVSLTSDEALMGDGSWMTGSETNAISDRGLADRRSQRRDVLCADIPKIEKEDAL